MAAVTVRYPLEPLADAMNLSLAALGRHFKIRGSTWKEYRDRGVSELVADRLACRAGLHPFVVWPDMADNTTREVSRSCDDCGASFVPLRKDGRFCGARCRRRYWSREVARRRRQRPDLAERNRQRRRAYYAENGEYERARERRRYWQRKLAEAS